MRNNFATTAFYKAHLETYENGVAVVEIPIAKISVMNGFIILFLSAGLTGQQAFRVESGISPKWDTRLPYSKETKGISTEIPDRRI